MADSFAKKGTYVRCNEIRGRSSQKIRPDDNNAFHACIQGSSEHGLRINNNKNDYKNAIKRKNQ